MPLTVLVADDNEVVRSSIVRILRENPDVEVVGESINYANAGTDRRAQAGRALA
jgi:DNA-binding NarL/FixJ family response regulator